MIKSICKISEQVKSFINPEQIKAIAESMNRFCFYLTTENHEVCMCFYLLSVMAYFYVVIIIHCHRNGYKRE